jgi:predicted nicotinamide N-methyase
MKVFLFLPHHRIIASLILASLVESFYVPPLVKVSRIQEHTKNQLLFVPARISEFTRPLVCTELSAKNTNKNKKRSGGPRGGGRRGKLKRDGLNEDEDTDDKNVPNTAEPSKVRKQIIELDRLGDENPFSVCAIEADDQEWMENPDIDYKVGGRLWPSSLAIAQFLASMGTLEGYDVLELGCGAGLVSIVAAECGARVVASDISPTMLKLCKIGWLETQKKNRPKKNTLQKQMDEGAEEVDESRSKNKPGSLNTFPMDLFADRPLPMAKNSSNQKVVTAGAMLYEQSLAAVLARRAFEACARGAWVIIGDDATGEGGGRSLFVAEFDKLEAEKGVQFDRTWSPFVVKNKLLKWNEKKGTILHLNAPESVSLGNDE